MFKLINNFESYKVDEKGNVWSTKSNKILKGNRNSKYHLVCLQKNGKQYTRKVHRLVAEAFIPNPHALPEVNHKDGNKQNNHVENLEWCTRSQNQKHAFETGLQKSLKGKENPMYGKTGKLNAKSKPVLMIRDCEEKEFESIELAVKWLKNNGHTKAVSSSISLCCNGKRYKSAYGYIWRFKNE